QCQTGAESDTDQRQRREEIGRLRTALAFGCPWQSGRPCGVALCRVALFIVQTIARMSLQPILPT
ncbi:MAG: hypothetical protein KGM99_07705, partial [Burkholderiales bacterium]|nr:hypothetical protein [Burkholderiales bacterium]